ncbi:MAG: FHA domain-containing protein [Hyphomicrobiaceae bacterium]
MQEKIYLGVKDHDSGDYYVSACTLPVQIGRQHEVNNQILLRHDNRRVSRIHGMIERTARGFVYTDSSGNGSRVGGLVVRDSRVALSPVFQIDIENYTISRIDLMPFIVLSTDERATTERQRLEILPGRGIGVVDTGRGMDMIDLNRWTEWDKPALGHFEAVEGQPYWVTQAHAAVTMVRNKSPIIQERTPLESLDVIKIGTTRFEILHPHEQRIVCGYDKCHLLNKPPLEANCKHCGRHLGNTGGFSRLL